MAQIIQNYQKHAGPIKYFYLYDHSGDLNKSIINKNYEKHISVIGKKIQFNLINQ